MTEFTKVLNLGFVGHKQRHCRCLFLSGRDSGVADGDLGRVARFQFVISEKQVLSLQFIYGSTFRFWFIVRLYVTIIDFKRNHFVQLESPGTHYEWQMYMQTHKNLLLEMALLLPIKRKFTLVSCIRTGSAKPGGKIEFKVITNQRDPEDLRGRG